MPYVYIVACADDSLYTGWTTDVAKRLAEHNNGTGARYTRGRCPVRVVYSEFVPDRSAALRREAAIKKLTRREKEHLLNYAVEKNE